MDRRSFLRTTTAVAAATAAATVEASANGDNTSPNAPHVHSGHRILKFASAWKESPLGFADHAYRLAQLIADASDGRIVVQHQLGGTQQVIAGDADAALVLEAEHLSLHPGFGFFAGLPGGVALHPLDFQAWLVAGGGQLLWDDMAAAHGFKPLQAGYVGWRGCLWASEPIANVSDFKGRRIYAEGLAIEVATAIGAEPQGSFTREAATEALRTGQLSIIDGVPFVAACDKPLYLTDGGIGCGRSALTLIFNRAFWDGLGQSEKALFEGVASRVIMTSIGDAMVQDGLLMSSLPRLPGVQAGHLGAEVVSVIRRIAEAVVADIGTIDSTASRINGSYEAYRRIVGNTYVHPGGFV